MNFISLLQDKRIVPLERSENPLFSDRLASALLALLPIFQHYFSLYKDLSTVLMVLLGVYFGARMLQTKEWRFQTVIPLIALSVFEILNSGFGVVVFAREMLLILYYVLAASCVVDLKTVARMAVYVAMAATALVMIQYVCYYILGFHLQLVPTAWLKDNAEQWIKLAETGRYSVAGNLMKFYRPSAFFLEPSHFTIYCFPVLALVLLQFKASYKRLFLAAFLSAGILLTTSGMGIALVFGMWALTLFHHLMGEGTVTERLKKLVKPRALLLYGIVAVALVVAYVAVPLFRESLNRIFIGSATTGNNAIEGRVNTGLQMISQLKGWEFWIGMRDWKEVHDWNMSGFFYTFYTQGLIGMLISYGFYVQCLIRLKGPRFWIAVMLVGMSFVTAQTHAAFYMIYFVLLLLGGYDEKEDTLRVKNFVLDALKKSSCAKQ